MRKLYILFICFINLACFYGCVKPYAPPATTINYNYLVVEGLINLTDSTYIKLSRTVTITNAKTTKSELKATVSIESNAGASYPLKELGNGLYAAAPLNLNAANQYRLRIKANGGGTYTSDFTASMVSPPIDSLSWKAGNNLDITVNTHDPKNATRYYRWDYNEAWIFHAAYQSFGLSDGYQVIGRKKSIYYCFGTDTSHLINLGTSAKLNQDVIASQPITTIVTTSEKIMMQYSILVKQYALTKDAYDYWALLKKNTENLGSIFDAQPSASIGNVHNVNNPNEPVIGYVSAGTVTTQRIFIYKDQLPKTWVTQLMYPVGIEDGQCALYTPNSTLFLSYFVNFKSADFLGPSFQLIPVDLTPVPTFSYPVCVDCTLRGSRTVPSYWQGNILFF